MNLKQLEYIIKIAEESNITKAAQQLFITQSALDQQLLKLEDELGIQLFNRSKSGFTLTEAGKIYVEYADRIIKLKNEAYTIISDLTERKAGTLSIGLTPERGIEMFMAVYPQFYSVFPYIKVIPMEIRVRQLKEMILNDSLDIGFITGSDISQSNLKHTLILEEEIVLAIPKSHPHAKLANPYDKPLKEIDLELFKDDPFVLMFKQSTQRDIIDPIFENAGFKPKIIFETASNHTLISMVEKGLSCAMVPTYYTAGNRNIACFALKPKPSWYLMACYKQKKYMSQAAKCFIKLATEYWTNRSDSFK